MHFSASVWIQKVSPFMLTFVGSTFSYKKGFVFVIIVLTLEINDYFGAKSIHIGAYIILF